MAKQVVHTLSGGNREKRKLRRHLDGTFDADSHGLPRAPALTFIVHFAFDGRRTNSTHAISEKINKVRNCDRHFFFFTVFLRAVSSNCLHRRVVRHSIDKLVLYSSNISNDIQILPLQRDRFIPIIGLVEVSREVHSIRNFGQSQHGTKFPNPGLHSLTCLSGWSSACTLE